MVVPTDTTTALPAMPDGEVVRLRIVAEVRVDPAVAAAGAPLPPGRYEMRVIVSVAGFVGEVPARVENKPFQITVTPDGRAIPSHRIEGSPRSASRMARTTRLDRAPEARATTVAAATSRLTDMRLPRMTNDMCHKVTGR